ncbi:M61 family metallopeptidase [Allopontixanthobacter sediminis]|uniref:Peptidase M61 catalytic domain-containing protein n=1 Tax=Allopontixanthobacter sediminis TaxID=1689985 RepID=A0A845B0F0_9SPHN|nr:hypothetical protein [Allopontixanthobacter sediminis]MXP43985.1 hypothetical protein [Allopontixanthobacter sediminis]
MKFAGDADGNTVLTLPKEFAGQQDLWRHISALEIIGGKIEPRDSATRILLHWPNELLTVRYRVNSAYDETPSSYAKGGAIIRPDWFAAFGEALFAAVEGRDYVPARYRWQGWPESWRVVSDIDHGQTGQAMTGADIVESTLLAGPALQYFERQIPNGTLRMGVNGTFQFEIADYVNAQTRVIAAQRKFWGDANGPYTVTLYALQDVANGSSAGGTGRSDGFALEATSDIDLSILTRILAHEHTHTWISRRVGELPKQDEALNYWFSEGVTDFYTGRTLLSAGVWTPAEFADDLNEALARYAGSPARDRPNNAIAREFWSDDDVQQLPYDRGRLFALLVDYQLRVRSGGSANYDDLLAIMRERWRLAAVDQKPELRSAFVDAASELGLNVRQDLARYIDAGERILLPDALFGSCAILRTVDLARFDPGFDRRKSSETGVIQGVVPDGPAAQAGLENGMKRIAYISSKEGDSRVPMVYRVAQQDEELTISWLPAGRETYTAQELDPSSVSGTAQCRQMLSGGDSG